MRRQIGIFTNTYGKWGASETVRGAAKVGLSNIELGLKPQAATGDDPLAEISDETSPQHIEAFRSLCAENNVRITSAFGHADIRTKEGLAKLIRQMEIAHSLGARFFNVSAPERSRTVYDNLLELGEAALFQGVLVCLETHPPLFDSAKGGLQTMRDLQHNNIRINFDTANLYYYNETIDALAELEQMLPYVNHVHLKDSRMKHEDWYFPALGEGTIDFPRMFRILDAVGFYGPFTMELEGISGEEDSLDLRHSRVVKSLAYLRGIGVM